MTLHYRCGHEDCGFEISVEDREELVDTAKRHEADRHDDILQRVEIERHLEAA